MCNSPSVKWCLLMSFRLVSRARAERKDYNQTTTGTVFRYDTKYLEQALLPQRKDQLNTKPTWNLNCDYEKSIKVIETHKL